MFTIKGLKASDFPEGKKVVFEFESTKYYDVQLEKRTNRAGWKINLQEKSYTDTFHFRMEEEIFEDYKTNLHCYAAYYEGKEVGIISFNHEEWNNTVRIWDLYLDQAVRRKGLGIKLIQLAIEYTRDIGARAVVLETQTCNYPAIQFYLSVGFELVGLDTISYTNKDIERNEVRLELGYLLEGTER